MQYTSQALECSVQRARQGNRKSSTRQGDGEEVLSSWMIDVLPNDKHVETDGL